jgi:hypothetical protein
MVAYSQKELDRAMKAALEGPPIKGISIAEHGFNVKPIVITRFDGGVEVYGGEGHHISHRLKWRPDDQVYYKFKKYYGQPVSPDDIEIDIKKRGFRVLIQWAIEAIKIALEILEIWKKTDSLGRNYNALTIEEKQRDLEKLLNGTWEGSAMFIILNVAARLE